MSEGALYAFAVAGALASGEENPTDAVSPSGPPAPKPLIPQANGTVGLDFSKQAAILLGLPGLPRIPEISVGVAGALSINTITDNVQASIADAGKLEAATVEVASENSSDLIAATGGLAFANPKSDNTKQGGAGAGVAGAVSINALTGATRSFIQSTDLDLTGSSGEVLLIEAERSGEIISVAASGAGAHASGSESGGSSGTALSVAGSVSVNAIDDTTEALLIHSAAVLQSGDATISAVSDPEIIAVAGGIAFSLATGGPKSDATAVAFGVAVGVNAIDGDVRAGLDHATIEIEGEGEVTVEAVSNATIVAVSLGGAVSSATGTSGDSIGITGAGSFSVNSIDVRTEASIADDSEVTVASVPGNEGSITVSAEDQSKITAMAGDIAVAFGGSGKGNGGDGSVGAAFAFNFIGTGGGSHVWATIEDSHVSAAGNITVAADEQDASIFSLAIGAVGSLNASGGSSTAAGLAGSVSVNKIKTNNQARVRDSRVTAEGTLAVEATDNSSINATAGEAGLAIALSVTSSKGASLSFSLTDNEIDHASQAAIEDSDVSVEGAVNVLAENHASIESLAFGFEVGAKISGTGSAIDAQATGALSFNTIESTVEATISSDEPESVGAVFEAGGGIEVAAHDLSTVQAVATASAVSVAGSTDATAVSIDIGQAVAHNRIDKDIAASIVGIPEVQTDGHDVTVDASDAATINVVSIAAAASVAIGDTAVGVAGGSSESTNIILSRTNAFVADSTLGSEDEQVGNVEIAATSSSTIGASVAGVAVAVGVGVGEEGLGAAAAIGIAVARNFIGYDPDGAAVPGTVIDVPAHDDTTTAPLNELVQGVTTVRIVDGALAGDIYQYIGPTQDDSDLTQDGAQLYDLRIQQYQDASLWKQVNIAEEPAQVRAFLENASVHAAGELSITANAHEDIRSVVVAFAAAIGVGVENGVGLSGAGVYAENQIRTDIKADIDGDGAAGISAASVQVVATDASTIDAIAGAASLAAAFGAEIGVAVSIGLSIGLNQVDNDVQAFIVNADNGITTSAGGVTISSATQGRHLFDLSNLGPLTADDLDNAAKAAEASPDDPEDPNQPNNDPNDPNDQTAIDFRNDAIHDHDVMVALRAAMDDQLTLLGQSPLALRDTVATESMFTTDSGRLAVAGVVGGDELVFNADHTFKTGDAVVYENDGGADIGLSNNTTYYVIVVDKRTIKLALTKDFAEAVTPIAITTLTQPAGDLGAQSIRPMFEVGQGTTVKLANGYAFGGEGGRVYEYIGPPTGDPDEPVVLDLATQNYASPNWLMVDKLRISVVDPGNSWELTSPDGTTYALQRTSAGGSLALSVGKDTINAISAAASVAVGIGGDIGLGLSGAGAVAQNVILGSTNAYAQDSKLTSAGDVSLSAQSASTISSTVVALSAAAGVAIAEGAGFGASIGIAVARNFIGWEPGADAATPLEVQSFLDDTPVQAVGNLSLTSLADQDINSFVLAGSVAIAIGSAGGIAASGSGVVSENRIGIDVASDILGTDLTPIHAASVTLSAEDTSSITAFAGAVSAAAALGVETFGAALSIGVTIATNTIDGHVEAAIDGADVDTTSGGVSVTATDAATINSVAAAASVAIGGGFVGIGISGAGALAENTIYGGTFANISDSEVVSAGDVIIDAEDASHIGTTIVSASAGVGIGAGGIGASIGVTLGRNLIGGALDTDPVDFSSAYLSTANVLTLHPGDQVRIVSGPRTGDVYQFLGTTDFHATYDYTTTDTPDQVKAGQRVFVPGSGGADDAVYRYLGKDPLDQPNLAAQDYGDTGKWQRVLYTTASAPAQIKTGDQVLIPGTGGGEDHVYQFVGKDPLDHPDLTAQDYTTVTKWQQVTAPLQQDYSNPDVWKLLNVDRRSLQVNAFVEDSSIEAVGALSITAKSEQTINAFELAGSAAIAAGGVAVGASGAGASSDNRITTDVAAFIDGDRGGGISATNVSITSSDLSHINASVVGVSVAAALGGIGGAISIGVSLATNAVDSTVDAYVANADVTASSGDITVSAAENAEIEATSVAVSAAVAIGVLGGLGISGAGAMAQNVILGGAHAYATNSELHAAGNVSFTALDNSEIDATIDGISVAAAGGLAGGIGVSIGAAVARNLIGLSSDGTSDPVEVMAYTEDTGIIAGGGLTLSATSQQSISAVVNGISVAIAGGFVFGLAAAGAGASAENRSAVDVTATINGDGIAGIDAGTITLMAHDESTIDALVNAVAVSVSFGVSAFAVSVGVAVAANDIGNHIEASISNTEKKVRSRSADIVLDAEEISTITTSSVAVAVAAAISIGSAAASGSGASSTNDIHDTVDAFILHAADVESAAQVSVTASDTATLDAKIASAAAAGGFVGVAVGVSVANNTIVDDVSASIGDSAVAAASGDIKITADYEPTIHTASFVQALAAGLAVGTGAGAQTLVSIAGTTAANVDASTLSAVGHKILVSASSTAETDPTTTALSDALGIGVAIGAMISDAKIEGATTASATGNSAITADELDILANTSNIATPSVTGQTAGAITGSGARSVSIISRTTDAFVGDGGSISASGSVTLAATSQSQNHGHVTLVDTSAIGIAASYVEVDDQRPHYRGHRYQREDRGRQPERCGKCQQPGDFGPRRRAVHPCGRRRRARHSSNHRGCGNRSEDRHWHADHADRSAQCRCRCDEHGGGIRQGRVLRYHQWCGDVVDGFDRRRHNRRDGWTGTRLEQRKGAGAGHERRRRANIRHRHFRPRRHRGRKRHGDDYLRSRCRSGDRRERVDREQRKGLCRRGILPTRGRRRRRRCWRCDHWRRRHVLEHRRDGRHPRPYRRSCGRRGSESGCDGGKPGVGGEFADLGWYRRNHFCRRHGRARNEPLVGERLRRRWRRGHDYDQRVPGRQHRHPRHRPGGGGCKRSRGGRRRRAGRRRERGRRRRAGGVRASRCRRAAQCRRQRERHRRAEKHSSTGRAQRRHPERGYDQRPARRHARLRRPTPERRRGAVQRPRRLRHRRVGERARLQRADHTGVAVLDDPARQRLRREHDRSRA